MTPVALLPSEDGAKTLANDPAVRDFIADAFAHLKFIGYVEASTSWFEKVGLPDDRDKGFIALKKPGDYSNFIAACRQLRYWKRKSVFK